MAVELVFSRALVIGSPTELTFGVSDDTGASETTLTIVATLPGPQVVAFVAEVVRLEVLATLPGPLVSTAVASGPPVTIYATLPRPVVTSSLAYASGTQRPVVGKTAAAWEIANKQKAYTTNSLIGGVSSRVGTGSVWQHGVQSIADWEHPLPGTLIAGALHRGSAWKVGDSLRQSKVFSYQDGLRGRRSEVSSLYQEAPPARVNTSFPYQDGIRTSRSTHLSEFQQGVTVVTGREGALSRLAISLRNAQDEHFKEAMRPPPGNYFVPVTPENPPCYIPSLPIKLLFHIPAITDGSLLFQCFGPDGGIIVPEEPTETLIIPTLNFYFIVNNLYMKVVSDGSNTPVEFTAVSIGTDASSWCWNFTATLTHEELEKVEPRIDGPVTVEVGVNGQVWRFLVESYDDSSTFADTSYTIKGRSVTAYLDSPFAPVRSWSQDQDYNSRQIAETELTNPGLKTGFTLDWNLVSPTGWLMPNGSWSFQDLSPLQVINTLVAGGGGFLASHQSAMQLVARPLNKYPSWDWSSVATTPDLILPHTYTYGRNLQWTEKPQYNGVYVSGAQTGLNLLVKRTGYAGDFQAPMVVNPFHTSEDVIRNVGMNILSAGGRQADVSFSMPLQEEYGLLKPGMLLEVTGGGSGAWRGMVRGISVTANWNDQGPEVAQSATIERHYGSF